jgi:hypothetical protein
LCLVMKDSLDFVRSSSGGRTRTTASSSDSGGKPKSSAEGDRSPTSAVERGCEPGAGFLDLVLVQNRLPRLVVSERAAVNWFVEATLSLDNSSRAAFRRCRSSCSQRFNVWRHSNGKKTTADMRMLRGTVFADVQVVRHP